MSRSLSACIIIFLLLGNLTVKSQSLSAQLKNTSNGFYKSNDILKTDTLQSANSISQLPDPKDVMFKSMIIPGWGQITNKQIWKVPLVYGLLGGLTWYSIDLTKKYHDYRAAFYNKNPDTPDDLRFGNTPAYLENESSLESLRSNRNFLRNRRDFIYITIGLAYGLNIIDAYVFAHMRSFDVSEDLSLRTTVKPSVLASGQPGFTLSMELFKNKNAR
ncbi:MAG: DUF5683 domain-containing protein [Candidatus Cyclobacteriaceae bacterium M2_1C_046]